MPLRSVFYENRLDWLFAHIRNVFYCSLILAVGSYTHKHPPEFLSGLPFPQFWGYPLIVVGLLLFLLNLGDALHRIQQISAHYLVKTALFLLTAYVTGWLVMVVWLFRVR